MTGEVLPFNPLHKTHLGESVGQAMLRQPVVPLSSISRFPGAGIYAIYYHGSFPSYRVIAHRNQEKNPVAPIYVGKAVPQGARKGGGAGSNNGDTITLYNRLREHRKSIEQAVNLDIADFTCRYLVVDDIWIPLGESLLIAKFSPIWNSLIDGFGNHTPGKGRFAGSIPRWDVLHPGRPWAEKCRPRDESAEQIATEAEDYLRSNPPPDDTTMITT